MGSRSVGESDRSVAGNASDISAVGDTAVSECKPSALTPLTTRKLHISAAYIPDIPVVCPRSGADDS